MQILSLNAAQIVNGSFVVNGLGTAQFSDVFPGVVGSNTVLFARVEYSWSGVTGGDGTSVLSVRGHVLTSNTPAVPTAGASAVNMWTRIGTSVTSFASGGSLSLGMLGAAAADQSEYCDITGAVAVGGPVVPFPRWWTLRLSNSGTAWTAGTLVINAVTLYA